MKMSWLEQFFEQKGDFPTPQWEAIYSHADNELKDSDQHELWCNIATTWMRKLKTSFPSTYNIHESDNFILLTSETDKYVSIFLQYLERTLKRISSLLPGIVDDEEIGKFVVLIFDDIDSYYSYLSNFYSKDGVYGLSSGVYLNQGYGHFAFPHQDLSYAESIAAHELTHALVAHLPLPLWLNEGIAVNIENSIVGSAPFRIDDELYDRHQNFWGVDQVQEFWSGKSFQRADEGQELSYHLAQFAVHSLSEDYDTFMKFVKSASYLDGGEAAAIKIYEGSLGGLITQFFGDGDWSPKPEKWQ